MDEGSRPSVGPPTGAAWADTRPATGAAAMNTMQHRNVRRRTAPIRGSDNGRIFSPGNNDKAWPTSGQAKEAISPPVRDAAIGRRGPWITSRLTGPGAVVVSSDTVYSYGSPRRLRRRLEPSRRMLSQQPLGEVQALVHLAQLLAQRSE